LRPLRIAVCVKPVPDPKQSNSYQIDPVTKTLVRKGITLVINPLDRHALEAGLKLKEGAGGKVTVFSMAPPSAEQTLTETLAMGADEAVLLSDLHFAGGDTLATARVLAAGLKKMGDWDLIICGAESFDGGTAQVGSQIAVIQGIPWITRVHHLEQEDDSHLLVTVEDENEQRDLLVQMPLLLTVESHVNQPRRLSLLGILAARKRKVTVYNANDLDLDLNGIGLNGSPTQTRDYFSPESDKEVEMLTGNPQQVVVELLNKLGL
jgi:electron transfer flavoprotein beta subunit